jgi:hypothetical protein
MPREKWCHFTKNVINEENLAFLCNLYFTNWEAESCLCRGISALISAKKLSHMTACQPAVLKLSKRHFNSQQSQLRL